MVVCLGSTARVHCTHWNVLRGLYISGIVMPWIKEGSSAKSCCVGGTIGLHALKRSADRLPMKTTALGFFKRKAGATGYSVVRSGWATGS